VSATDLLLWGAVIHLVIDWLAQNEWMAVNKAKRRTPNVGDRGIGVAGLRWWDRHPAAYVHAGLHSAAQLLVFPWPAALAIGVTHLLIDTRKPVQWWSKLIRQTQPDPSAFPLMDIGADVRIWVDQVWHIAAIALAALAVSL